MFNYCNIAGVGWNEFLTLFYFFLYSQPRRHEDNKTLRHGFIRIIKVWFFIPWDNDSPMNFLSDIAFFIFFLKKLKTEHFT